MGGATSKLDENDWEKADGKLISGSEYTLDGAPPTEAYGVYLLTKKGVNQREFDVTDAEQNLIYTTRAVPGTIACFDVLGRGIGDDYLLRVNVGMARRYWTVCRFDVPTFWGQKTDQEAIEKLTAEIDGNKTFSMPLLYKKCLITVSWSRYLAVAALFGAPTAEMLISAAVSDTEESEESVDDEVFKGASRIAERMRTRAVSSGAEPLSLPRPDTKEIKEDDDDATKPGATVEEATEINSKETTLELQSSASMPELSRSAPPSGPDDELPTSSSAAHSTPLRAPPPASPVSSFMAGARVGSWFRQQSQTIRKKSQSYLSSTTSQILSEKDPLEGVIQLDKPLLLCQEIYNKLIGNHQTSLVSKEKVLELLQQDMAEHVMESPDEAAEDETYDPFVPVDQETRQFNSDDLPESGVLEGKNESIDDGIDGVRKDDDESESDNAHQDTQPIVGYWSWDNTLRVHKMKMHLAKGSDLSLHVVLAIIANQVRYERNAIAMTV
jgi:hypothetical protein